MHRHDVNRLIHVEIWMVEKLNHWSNHLLISNNFLVSCTLKKLFELFTKRCLHYLNDEAATATTTTTADEKKIELKPLKLPKTDGDPFREWNAVFHRRIIFRFEMDKHFCCLRSTVSMTIVYEALKRPTDGYETVSFFLSRLTICSSTNRLEQTNRHNFCGQCIFPFPRNHLHGSVDKW